MPHNNCLPSQAKRPGADIAASETSCVDKAGGNARAWHSVASDRGDNSVPCGNDAFVSTLLMFVLSLSWQTIDLYNDNGAKNVSTPPKNVSTMCLLFE